MHTRKGVLVWFHQNALVHQRKGALGVPPLYTGAYKKRPCCVASPQSTGSQKGCVPNPTPMDLCYFPGSCHVITQTKKCWMRIGTAKERCFHCVASPQCTTAYKESYSLFDFSAIHRCIQEKVLPLCGCSTIQQCT